MFPLVYVLHSGFRNKSKDFWKLKKQVWSELSPSKSSLSADVECILFALLCSSINGLIGLMSRAFANGPGGLGFSPRSGHTEDSKIVLEGRLTQLSAL